MTKDMHELLKPFPVVIELPVLWGQMDAFQHVNNVEYFRYFESARIAYFDRLPYAEQMQQTGIGPILASTQCSFKFPLTYPDTVSVGARVNAFESDRFTMHYLVWSQRFQRKAAEGVGIVVSFNYREQKKVPVPDVWRQQIEELERGK